MTRKRWIHFADGLGGHLAIAAALVGLVAIGGWQRWQVLASSPFPLGVDGYYYPIQLRALLEDGALHYPASPLTFWFMLPFAAATDPITGAKLGAALGVALAALPAFGIAVHLTKQRTSGLIAAAIVATSVSSTFLSIEFVKQGIGLTVALTAIWLLLRALATPSRIRIALAALAIVATVLAHKLAAAFVLAVAVPAIVQEARARGVMRGRRLLYLLVTATIVVVAIIVIGIIAPQRFLSAGDLSLLQSSLTSDAHWAPALVRPGLTLWFANEATIGTVVACVACVVLVFRIGEVERSRRSARIVAWGFVVLGLAIGLPWLDVTRPQGLGLRLRACAFVPLAICASLVIDAITPLRTGWRRDAVVAVIALAIVIQTIHRTSPEATEGRVVAHPALVSAVLAASTKIPAGTTLIVPERHIMFMTAWYTRAPVAMRAGSIPHGRRMRMLPLHFIEMGSPLDEALDAARRAPGLTDRPIGLHARHRNGLVLVTEPTWEWLLATLPPGAREHWGAWPTI